MTSGIFSSEDKKFCRRRLENLLASYDEKMSGLDKSKVSEETVRSWLNEFLKVFGWDVKDVRHVLQERTLTSKEKTRLGRINSKHKRPDYTLLDGPRIATFLDAKALSVDVFADRAAAFQIRSYGWSAQVPCAFISNFEQLAIFDTRYVPEQGQSAQNGVIQIARDQYIAKFDILFDRLWYGNVTSGRLSELYATVPSEGDKTLDAQFVNLLSEFRRKLAVGIYSSNRRIIVDAASLNYYVQVILDRLIFIRVCESRGIERAERLRAFQSSKQGFWKSFRSSCYMEFYNHYDGAMFERDAKFQQMVVADEVFDDFINSLYYPSPYRFDVIPVMLLANIYEEFLGKRLEIKDGKIVEVIKGEYVKTRGAIPTPEHLVRRVCNLTLPSCVPVSDAELFGRKILDPCCGSGVFLTACYEIAEEWFIAFLKSNEAARRRHQNLFIKDGDKWLLTLSGRRKIITECLFGIDVDESAIEVTKMSLALKIIDGNHIALWDKLGANGKRILRDVSENVRLGNTLVQDDGSLSDEESFLLKAFDPRAAFPSVYADGRGGFSYIVCNPPYVETKFFKAADPAYHAYLSGKYAAFEGKADLAVLFVERCRQLVSENGRIGFIVHRRWFRTLYGAGIRRLINETRSLERVVEYQSSSLFRGRTNYVAIMTLVGHGDGKVYFERVPGGSSKVIDHPTGDAPWVFGDEALMTVKRRLLSVHGNFGAFPGLQIKDGIQALWKKLYHLEKVRFLAGVATGVNGFGEEVKIEKGILRGVVYNVEFYPFKPVEPDAWCVFPYRGSTADAISWSEMKKKFPLAYQYLKSHRKRITEEVKCREGEKWHTFTREHNHGMYNVPKIVVPMTARDTVASYSDGRQGLYMDNSNVWFISIEKSSEKLMKAVTAVINSTVFSVLAKADANPQRGDYYKFNKQFLSPVPFPSKTLISSSRIQGRLAKLYDEISALEKRWFSENANHRSLTVIALKKKWSVLDACCYELYGMSANETSIVKKIGRTADRTVLVR